MVEQATGFVESVDATQHLNDAGYWGSYNVPYFPRVYNTSGYIEKAKQEGNEFSYTECARAKIFKQQQVRRLFSVCTHVNFQMQLAHVAYTPTPTLWFVFPESARAVQNCSPMPTLALILVPSLDNNRPTSLTSSRSSV